jgi:hypothetical protein
MFAPSRLIMRQLAKSGEYYLARHKQKEPVAPFLIEIASWGVDHQFDRFRVMRG